MQVARSQARGLMADVVANMEYGMPPIFCAIIDTPLRKGPAKTNR
jgi:hypothetical protein